MQNMFMDKGSPHYKPLATRTPILFLLLLFTLLLIALIELACRSIPAHDGFGMYGIVFNDTSKYVVKRDVEERKSFRPKKRSNSSVETTQSSSSSSLTYDIPHQITPTYTPPWMEPLTPIPTPTTTSSTTESVSTPSSSFPSTTSTTSGTLTPPQSSFTTSTATITTSPYSLTSSTSYSITDVSSFPQSLDTAPSNQSIPIEGKSTSFISTIFTGGGWLTPGDGSTTPPPDPPSTSMPTLPTDTPTSWSGDLTPSGGGSWTTSSFTPGYGTFTQTYSPQSQSPTAWTGYLPLGDGSSGATPVMGIGVAPSNQVITTQVPQSASIPILVYISGQTSTVWVTNDPTSAANSGVTVASQVGELSASATHVSIIAEPFSTIPVGGNPNSKLNPSDPPVAPTSLVEVVTVGPDGKPSTSTQLPTSGLETPPIIALNGGQATVAPASVVPVTTIIDGNTFTKLSSSPTTQAAVPIISVSNGQTITLLPNSAATSQVLVQTIINGQTFQQVPSPVATFIQGQPFIATPAPSLIVIEGHTFVQVPTIVQTVINGQTFTQIPTPILTVSNGHTYTAFQVPAPSLTVIDGQTIAQVPTPSIKLTVIGGQTFEEIVTPLATAQSQLFAATVAPSLTVVNGETITLPPVTPLLTVISGQTYTVPQTTVVTVINGHTFTELPTPVITVINGHTYTEIAIGIPTSDTIVVTTTLGQATSTSKSTTTNPVHPISTFVNDTGTYLKWSNGGVTLAPQITGQQYIFVAWLPLVLAALYTIPWKILDNTFREMEPFHQLHQPNGATSENSLCLSYGSALQFTVPFKALFRGHFIVFWSSLISLAVLILPPMSSEAFFVSLKGTCGPNLPHDAPRCYASWAYYPKLARPLEGLLAFIAVLLVFLMFFSHRRKSGLYSEPLSIVGLAVLIAKSPVLRDFRKIDSEVSNKELKTILAGKRYVLSHFYTADGELCHGIVPIDIDHEAGFSSSPKIGRRPYGLLNLSDVSLDGPEDRTPREPTPVPKQSHFWWAFREKGLYILGFLVFGGLETIIAYYNWTHYDSSFEHFMDDNSFGVRFMMTSLGVAAKVFWSSIDSDLRRYEPLYRLLAGSSKPQDSILIPTYTSPFSSAIHSLKHQHYLVSFISLNSILAEILPIVLANINFSPALTKLAYDTCSYIAMFILSLMIIGVLFLLFRKKGGRRQLQRKVKNMAGMMVYLASKGDGSGEGLMDEVGGLWGLETKERNQEVEGKGRVYGLGVVEGDGARVEDERRIGRLWGD